MPKPDVLHISLPVRTVMSVIVIFLICLMLRWWPGISP
jgi:hypothetical protein